MLVFLLDCLRFSKLLKLHQTEGRISSNLLKRSNPAGKQASCAAGLSHKSEVRSNKLINHNQVFFSHLSVIGQFIASNF